MLLGYLQFLCKDTLLITIIIIKRDKILFSPHYLTIFPNIFAKTSRNVWQFKEKTVILHLELGKGYNGHAPMKDMK